MLKNLLVELPIIVSAKLVKTIEFKAYKVASGTEVILDSESNIALIYGLHVQLDATDYTIVRCN